MKFNGSPDKVIIYGLFDPRTNEIRYVGKANDAERRFADHLRRAGQGRLPVNFWIKSMRPVRPIMRVLNIVSRDAWQREEIEFIKLYRNNGAMLLNVTDGGDQADRSYMNARQKRFYEAVRNASVDLHRARELKGYISEGFYAKMLLSCMILAKIYPTKIPVNWKKLVWDRDRLGSLTIEKARQVLSPNLLSRFSQLSDVLAST